MTTIGQIAGIDHFSATRLRKAGIKTAEGFVRRTRQSDRLRLLSQETGIDCQKLLDMATSVDLLQLRGIGGRYSALLRAAGIHKMEDLHGFSEKEFREALTAANHEHRIVRRLPSTPSLQTWLRQASEYEGSRRNG